MLSSGTLGTPQILERSGVGDAKLLKELDIKVISDLPGVGYVFENISEVNYIMATTATSTKTTTRRSPVSEAIYSVNLIFNARS